MFNGRLAAGLAAGLMVVLLGGCAGGGDNGRLMRGYASDTRAQARGNDRLAKEWEKGRKLVREGEKQVKNGQQRVESAQRDFKKGQDQVERGQRQIAEGTRLMKQSESRFGDSNPDLKLKSRK